MFSGVRPLPIFIAKDAENDVDARAYFEHGYEALEYKLQKLQSLDRPLTRREAEELRLILDAVISAQKVKIRK